MPSVAIVIPARGGSKGIPRKNIQTVGPYPLVGNAVRICRDVRGVDGVYVSTEDDVIAEVASEFGASLIHRPHHLAQDSTPTGPVIRHAVMSMEDRPDMTVVVQCTTPFLRPSDIQRTIETLEAHREAHCAVTVNDGRHLVMDRDGQGYGHPLTFTTGHVRRQDERPLFALNGGAFAMWTDKFMETANLLAEPMLPVPMDCRRGVDIDTPEDLELARCMADGGYLYAG